MTDFEFNGWLSKVAVKYRHSSPMYLEKILHFLEFHLVPLEKLEADLRYYCRSVKISIVVSFESYGGFFFKSMFRCKIRIRLLRLERTADFKFQLLFSLGTS